MVKGKEESGMISVVSPVRPINVISNLYTFNVDNDKVSDDYHTMQELYDTRLALCVKLFECLHAEELIGKDLLSNEPWVVKSKLHNDGTMFDGYFVIAANLAKGQISFHYALEHWDKFQIPEVERIPWEYDGHKTSDVIERLME